VFGYQLFPIFLFLSVIWFTSKLASNTEVIAVLSSGISFYRYLRPFLISASIIAVLAFGASMFWVPNASESYNSFKYEYINKGRKVMLTENIYKQIGDDDFIYISNYNASRQVGYNFTWEHFEDNQLVYKIKAQNIRWVEKDSIHRLSQFFQRTIVDDKEVIRKEARLDTLLALDLNAMAPVTYKAHTLNFFELNKYIEQERENGSPLINSHLLVRHKRWSLPISAFILTLIAVAVASFKKAGRYGYKFSHGHHTGFPLYLF
jgi:lipopolysaccharide export system permease protein